MVHSDIGSWEIGLGNSSQNASSADDNSAIAATAVVLADWRGNQ